MVNDAAQVAGLKWPYPGQKFTQAILDRDAKVDLVASLRLVLEKDPARNSTFIDAAGPLWQAVGAAQIQVTGSDSKDSMNLVWSDGDTQMTLSFPHNQEAASVEMRDASGKSLEKRLEIADKRDTEERRERWTEGKTLSSRVGRNIEGIELGLTREELDKRLLGRQALRHDTPAGTALTFTGYIDDSANWVLRHALVRFDESGLLVEARLRYTEAPNLGKKTSGLNRLEQFIRDNCGGAPELVPDKQSFTPADPKHPVKVLRWQDDKTLLQTRRDQAGIELILKDCPLEFPNGAPLPPANWLPRGPMPECTLDSSKADVLKHWKISAPQEGPDGGLVLRPTEKSPHDAYVVFFDGQRVSRIVARSRQTGESLSQPTAASKAVMAAWGQNAAVFGWPWQQAFNRQGHLQSWSTHDETTQVRVFWQNQGESGLRVFTEWK